MNAAQRGARHGEETERIVVAQIGFAGDREAGNVRHATNVVCRDAERGEPVAIEGNAIGHIGHQIV